METEWRVARARLRDLVREKPKASHAELAQSLGYSISWVRKWRKRLEQARVDDEQVLHCLSHRPHVLKRVVSAQVENRIIDLRVALSEYYHRKVGARTIAAYLRTEAAQWEGFVPKSSNTIWRILRRRQYILSPVPRSKQAFEPTQSGVHWEIDFCTAAKRSPEAPEKQQNALEVFNVVDRGSSACLDSQASVAYDAEHALLAMAATLRKWGVPRCITYDRDPRLVGSQSTDEYPSAFTRYLLCVGCTPDILPPHRPDLKLFVERFQRTLKEECLYKHRPETSQDANTHRAPYCQWYNHERPHQGRANRDHPPQQQFRLRASLPPLPEQVDPDSWLEHYHQRYYRRHVNANGTIQLWKQTYYVGIAYVNQTVIVRLDAHQRMIHIEIGHTVLKSIPLRGLVGKLLDYQDFLGFMADEARSEWKTYLWTHRSQPQFSKVS